jgi:hypothetical protein
MTTLGDCDAKGALRRRCLELARSRPRRLGLRRGLGVAREASINDVPIRESERKFHWPAPGPRPADHPGIPDVK